MPKKFSLQQETYRYSNDGVTNTAYNSTYDVTDFGGSSQPNKSKQHSGVSDTKEKTSAPLLVTFRYADKLDIFLMLAGTICAIIHGSFYNLINIVIGEQMDKFIQNDRANTYVNSFESTWKKYGIDAEFIRQNKTVGDQIARHENITFNSSYLPDFDREGALESMVGYTYWYLLAAAVVLFSAFGQICFWIIAAERQVRRIRTSFLKAVLRQDISWYDRLGSGEMNTRLSDDMRKIADGMGDKFGTFLQLFACFVAAFVIGFAYGWEMTLSMLLTVPALVGSALLASWLNASLTNKELKAYAKAGKVAEEVLGSVRTVIAFGGEDKESKRYNNNLFEARDRGIRKGLILGIGMGIAWLVLYLSYALGFYLGVNLVLDPAMKYTPGTLLIIFFSIVVGATSIGQAGPNIQAIATARGACVEIFKIIDRVPEIDSSSPKGLKPTNLRGNISFRDVNFSYPTRPDVQVLRGLNLDVSVGQTVALVGSSGCGKSTTVQLLQRFYDVASGSITIDGIDIREFNVRFLREYIGIVSQEPILFGTSIAENIRYGRDGVTMEEIEQATREANAYNFIQKLPDKFETLVGDRGAQLSGGQKQRIAIARALVRNPKILLLDEATSALDTESEASVQAALDAASVGRTTIVIAHRLSTVRRADLICGFEKGVIVERGNHEQLMKQGGIYYQLVTLQSRQQALDAQAGKLDATDSYLEEEIAVASSKKPIDEYDVIDQLPDEGLLGKIAGSIRRSVKALSRVGSGTAMGSTHISKLANQSAEDQSDVDKYMQLYHSELKLNPAPVSRIIAMNKPETAYIIIGCIAAILNGAENPVFAVVFTAMLSVFTELDDDVARSDTNNNVIIFIIIGAILFFSQFFQYYMFGHSGERLTMRLRRLAFSSMLKQEIGWFDDHKNNIGALTTRLATDASNVQGATGSRLALILQNFANVGIGVTIGFVIGWKLALMMCAVLPLIVITGAIEATILAGVATKDKKELEKAGKLALEAIENIRTVAALTKEDAFCEMYNNKLEVPYRNSLVKARVFGIAFSVSQALLYVTFGISFLFGAYLIREGELNFNQVFMVVSVVIFGAIGVGQTIAFAPDYTKARVAAARLFYLFDRKPTIIKSNTDGTKLNNFYGEVRFNDVRFRYPTRPEVPILRGLNLVVQPGQTLALVGSSGCGKSTTVQLVERFYDALRGEVLFGGQNIKSLNLGWVRSQIGIVSQEPILFDSTIAENIAYGDNSRTVPMTEIIEAAKNSNIHSFIEALPKGYNTRVGDRGTQLSGGQKQRVAIARALLRHPKILLLDEATSALDTESEKVVQEALDAARAGRTCIVIAHRLSTIQDADQIAVFHNGRVVELGTHTQLLKLEGIYYGLQQVQAGKK